MNATLTTRVLTAEAFAPYGDLLDARGQADKIINRGLCQRFHDRASLDFGDGRAGISVFLGEVVAWPVELALVERHPDGSQAFVSMTGQPFLVVAARDRRGRPETPEAFIAAPGQAINFHRGTWHGVLTPLHAPGLFAVVDRIGDGPNLEEHWFDAPFVVEPGQDCVSAGLAQSISNKGGQS